MGPSPKPQDRHRGICGKPGHRFRRCGRGRRCHVHCAGFACAASQLKPALYCSSSNIGKSEPVAFGYSDLEPSRLTQRVPHSNADTVSHPDRFPRANHSRSGTRAACGTRRSASASGPRTSSGPRSSRSSASPRPSRSSASPGHELGARGDPRRFLPQRRGWNARNFRRREHLHMRRQRPGQERPLPLELIRNAVGFCWTVPFVAIAGPVIRRARQLPIRMIEQNPTSGREQYQGPGRGPQVLVFLRYRCS